MACGILISRLGFRDRHLVIRGIDLDQRRSRFHILVVVHQKLDHMPGDARADGIEVAIDLGVVSGFIAAQVAPEKKSSHQQHNSAHDQGQAKARIARGLLPAEISLRSRQGRMFASFNLRRVRARSSSVLVSILLALQILPYALFRISHGAHQFDLGQVVSVQA